MAKADGKKTDDQQAQQAAANSAGTWDPCSVAPSQALTEPSAACSETVTKCDVQPTTPITTALTTSKLTVDVEKQREHLQQMTPKK